MDDGVESVLVPVQERKRVKRIGILDAVLETSIADNTLALSKQEMSNMQDDVVLSFGQPQATGTVMPHAPTASITAPPAPRVPIALNDCATPACAGASDFMSVGFAPLPSPIAEVAQEAAVVPAAPAGGKRAAPAAKRKAAANKRGRPADGKDAGGSAGAAVVIPNSISATKGKVAGKAAAGSSRGAPKRDFPIMLCGFMQKLVDSQEDNVAYWGTEYSSMRKWILRQERDFREFMKTVSISTQYDAADLILKGFSQTHVIMDAFANKTELVPESDSFGLIFDNAENFLKMPPSVPLPFPKWLIADRHRNVVARADTGEAFWKGISQETLLERGFADVAVHDSQTSFIAERIMSINQGQTTIPQNIYQELFDSAPIDELHDNAVRALDIILCVLSKGKKRITRYQPVPHPDVPADVLDDPDCPILKAFKRFNIGQQASKAYKKVMKRGAEVAVFVNDFKDHLTKFRAAMEASTVGVDSGKAMAEVLKAFDSKVGKFSDEDRLVISEQAVADATLTLGAAVDRTFQDFTRLIAAHGKELAEGKVGTENQSKELGVAYDNFKLGAQALAESKEIKSGVWGLTDCAEIIKLLAEVATTLSDLVNVDAEAASLSEAMAARIYRVITTSNFDTISRRYPSVDGLAASVGSFYASLATEVRRSKLHGFIAPMRLQNLLRLLRRSN
jgi:hypothetical protein